MAGVARPDAPAGPPVRDDYELVGLLDPSLLRKWEAQSAEWDSQNVYPRAAVEQLASLGVMGATFPVADEGRGATLRHVVEAIFAIAHHSGILARIVVDSNLGPTAMVIEHASDHVRREVLAEILRGGKPAIAISEPTAGSDVSSLRTRLEKKNGKLLLTGEKVWITGAPISQHYVVFARMTDAPDHSAIGAVLVRKDRHGVRFGEAPVMMGMRGLPEGTVVFDGYELEPEDVLIPPGGGFKTAMALYNSQRLGAATVAVGLAHAAFERSVAHAKERRQFGRPIAENQGLRWLFADMAIDLEITMSYIRRVADLAGCSFTPDPLRVAVAKVRAAEMAITVTNAAIQIFGAAGYAATGPVERLFRDARMFTIGGGTTEMLRDLVGKRILGGSRIADL